jgi:hypothetical protein
VWGPLHPGAGSAAPPPRCRPQPPRRPHLPRRPAGPAGPPGTPPRNRGGFPRRRPRRLARRRRFRPRSPGPPGPLRRRHQAAAARGAVPGEQPQSRQAQHAPGVTLSRAMRCGHGGRARPGRAKTAVRLPRIPATGRELLRAPRSAERDGARRGPDRLPGRHPPGQRSYLATDRITGSVGDRDVPPDVDSLAHKLPGITAMASGKQAGSGPARPHLQLMASRGSGARVLAPAIAPVITQRPPERGHRAHPGLPSPPGTAGDLA